MVAGPTASSSHVSASSTAAQRRKFNPCVIVLQIIVLQAVYYIALACFTSGLNWAFGVLPVEFSAQLFGSGTPGAERRINALSTVLTAAGPCALVLALLVRRARRCADHAATLLLAHVIIAVSLHGLPHRPLWWVLQISATVCMSVVAESLCRIIEARERDAFRSDINAAAKSIGNRTGDGVKDCDPGSPGSRLLYSSSTRSRSEMDVVDSSDAEEDVSLLVDEM